MLSFESVFDDFTPEMFPLAARRDDHIIAPFWDDVDFRKFGQVLFRLTSFEALLNEVGKTINDAFNTTFSPTSLFIATWDGVPAFSETGTSNLVSTVELLSCLCT